MRSKLMLIVASLALLVGGAVSSQLAEAATRAESTVTIRAQGTDLSGQVRSPRPNRCARNRQVVVFKQVGTLGGGNDIRIASDNAEFQNGAYRWSTGNTGMTGRIYAKVFKNANCKGDVSPTILVQRNP